MLLADLGQQLTLLRRQLAAATAIGARGGSQGCEAARLVGVVPALKRGDRIALGRLGLGRSEALLAELGESLGELTAVELATRVGADDLAAKQRDRLGVSLGNQRRP